MSQKLNSSNVFWSEKNELIDEVKVYLTIPPMSELILWCRVTLCTWLIYSLNFKMPYIIIRIMCHPKIISGLTLATPLKLSLGLITVLFLQRCPTSVILSVMLFNNWPQIRLCRVDRQMARWWRPHPTHTPICYTHLAPISWKPIAVRKFYFN